MKLYLLLYGIVMLAFCLFILWIGARGLLKKRPVVIPARHFMWIMIAVYFPMLYSSFVGFFETSGSSHGSFNPIELVLPVINLLLMVILVYVFWRSFTGYLLFGVSEEGFRAALTSTLNKLNLPYEETISKIKLTSIGTELQAAVHGWVGTAQIRIKQRTHFLYTKEIAKGMDDYFKGNAGDTKKIIFVVYLLLGVLMIVFLAFFLIFMVSLTRFL